MRKRLAAAVLGAALASAIGAPVAFAGNGNAGWGTVVSQRASTLHDMGTHSSSFAVSRRLGLANVTRAVLGSDATLADLGAALGSLDSLDETQCP